MSCKGTCDSASAVIPAIYEPWSTLHYHTWTCDSETVRLSFVGPPTGRIQVSTSETGWLVPVEPLGADFDGKVLGQRLVITRTTHP